MELIYTECKLIKTLKRNILFDFETSTFLTIINDVILWTLQI